MSQNIRLEVCAEVRRLAEHGLAVFPLHNPTSTGCSCGDPACGHPGKHPRIRGWQDAAKTDAFLVDLCWKQHPDHNVGVVTLGLLVLDVDPRSGGDRTLRELVEKHGSLPETWEVRSGGGGTHYWFRLPEGTLVQHGANKLGPGLDVKAGRGSYIVAPPSLHASGRRYEWIVSPDRCDLAMPPEWILARLVLDKPQECAVVVATDASAGSGDGNQNLRTQLVSGALKKCDSGSGRHDAAFWLACQLRDNRFSFEAASGAIEEFVRCCPSSSHPFTLAEGMHGLDQAYSRPAREPWGACVPVPVFRNGKLNQILADGKADARNQTRTNR